MANSITKIYKNGVEYDIYASGGASVNTASATTAGVVKLGSDTVQTQAANSPSSTSGKTYPIQVNNGGQEVVNVPWTDHTYTSSSFDIKDLTDSTELRTTWSGKQDALVSGTNIKTVNNESILGSGNITISGGHDYSWNTLTGTSFTLSGTNYRNLISTSSDTTVSVGTGLTPGMEYIIRITNSDSDNDHTMTFNSVAYIIPKSGTVTYKWLALTATTVEFEGPRYVYSMPATPEEGFIYYVLPQSGGGWTPSSTALAYYTFDDQGADGYVKDTLNGYNLIHGTQPSYTQVLDTNYAGNYYNAASGIASNGVVNGWTSYLNSSFSLALWFKISSSSGDQYIAMLNDGSNQISLIYNFNSGQLETYGDTRATILSNTQTDTWYCLGITRGNGTLKTYLNGTLVNSVSTTHTQGNSSFVLGGTLATGSRFHGLIGECVTDSVLWSNTDFSDYYDQTKANYGIS